MFTRTSISASPDCSSSVSSSRSQLPLLAKILEATHFVCSRHFMDSINTVPELPRKAMNCITNTHTLPRPRRINHRKGASGSVIPNLVCRIMARLVSPQKINQAYTRRIILRKKLRNRIEVRPLSCRPVSIKSVRRINGLPYRLDGEDIQIQDDTCFCESKSLPRYRNRSFKTHVSRTPEKPLFHED